MDTSRDNHPFSGFKTDDAPQSDSATELRECERHGSYTSERPRYGGRWLMPWTGCQACAAEAEERERARAAQRAEREEQDRRRELLVDSGLLGTRFESATFEAFNPTTPKQRKGLQMAQQFAATVDWKSGGGLLLIGPPGVGKTHLAAAVVLNLTQQRGMPARIVGAREYIRRIRATWGGEGNEAEVLRDHVAPAVLVLDDLGAGGAASDNEQALLLDLVNARYERLRPVIVTSNLTRPELRAALDGRTWDRLQHGATFAPLDGDSNRRPAA